MDEIRQILSFENETNIVDLKDFSPTVDAEFIPWIAQTQSPL